MQQVQSSDVLLIKPIYCFFDVFVVVVVIDVVVA